MENLQMENNFWVRNRRWIVFGLLLLGLLLRLFAWKVDPILKPDAITYLMQARQWAESGTLISDQPPLFIWLLKLLYQAGLEPLFWGVVLNIFFGMVFLWTIWKSADVLFPDKTAIAYCILFFAAIHPPLILLSVQILRDMPYLTVMGIFLWRFLILFRKDCGNPQVALPETVLLGVVLAVGCFFRHEAFAGLIFFLLYQMIAVCVWHRGKICLFRIPVICTAFLATFLLLGTFTDFYANCRTIYSAQYKESIRS